MKAAELVAQLSRLPGDTLVVLHADDVTEPCEFVALEDFAYEEEPDPTDLDGMTVEAAALYLTALHDDGCTGNVTATPAGVFVHHDEATCPIHAGDDGLGPAEYERAIDEARDLLSDGSDDEYRRGIVELLARTYAKRGVFTEDRMRQIVAELGL